MLGKIIGLVVLFLGVFGGVSLLVSYIPSINYALKGDVVNATSAATNATVDNLIEELEWATVGAVIIAIASIIGFGALARRIFG